MHKRFRDLFSPKALPAWVLLVWNIVGALSRIEYIGKKMSVLSNFAETPLGNIVLLLISVAWLTLVVCWPGLKSWWLGQTATAIAEVDLVTNKDQESPLERLLLRQMEQKCEAILSVYRRLEYDDRERVRFPFSNSSWPAFGEKWEYVHVTLYRLRIEMALFKVELIQLCGVLGESEVPFPDIGESVLMVDLLAAMQSLAD